MANLQKLKNILKLSILNGLLLRLVNGNAPHFEYKDQSAWYDQFPYCSGKMQSPIELLAYDANNSYLVPSLHFDHYSYEYPEAAIITNNGHSVEISPPQPAGYQSNLWKIYDKVLPRVRDGPLENERYVVENLHFHWGSMDHHGSEHVIEGERFSLEMHIVHRNVKYENFEKACTQKNGLLVLAVMYNTSTEQEHQGLKPIVDALANVKKYRDFYEIDNFKLSDLTASLNPNDFFTYEGSLTRPPCTEGIRFIVFMDPIPITKEQMSPFRELFDQNSDKLVNNYRALQSRGKRQIFRRRSTSTSSAQADIT